MNPRTQCDECKEIVELSELDEYCDDDGTKRAQCPNCGNDSFEKPHSV